MLILKAKLTNVQKLKTQINLTFAVKEYSEEDDLRFSQFIDCDGYLLYNPSVIKREIEEAMKDRELAVEEGKKSPSQRLRGAIYTYWNMSYEGEESFEDFYLRCMEGFINRVKTKIDVKVHDPGEDNQRATDDPEQR